MLISYYMSELVMLFPLTITYLGGSTSPFLVVCQVLMLLVSAYMPHLSPDFLGWVTLHSLSLHGDTILELVFAVGQLHLGQMSFGPLPHHPRIQHRGCIERVPPMLTPSSAWQTQDGTSTVLFTLYSSRKWCTDRIWHGDRYSDQFTHPRCWKDWYLPVNQNSGISMEVGSGWFWCHI